MARGKAGRKSDFWLEVRRQVVHVAGIGNIFAVMVFGLVPVLWGLVGQVAGFAVLSLYLLKHRKGLIAGIVYKFERKKEHPFSGAFYWALGVLLALLLFPQNAAFAGIAVLAISDAASTLIGKYKGRHDLPFNKSKSWEGSAAFFFTAALVLQFFINPVFGIVIAGIAAIVEMAPKVNDNVTVPVATAALVMLLG
jgi:dolichol kinase